MARIIGARMGELLGQSVIVENVTGAGGIIGVQHVINAKPDGYTVLLGTVGTHAYLQSIYRKRRYDAGTERHEDAIRLGRRWVDYASCLRAAQREDRRRRDPHSLSGGRACREQPDRRPHPFY